MKDKNNNNNKQTICKCTCAGEVLCQGHDSTMSDIVWMAPHAHMSLSGSPQSMWQAPQWPWFVLSDLEYTTVSLALWILEDGYYGLGLSHSWPQKPNSNHHAIENWCPLAPRQTIEVCTTLADVDMDEGGHYWGAMHGAQLLWPPVHQLLLRASKQVVQCVSNSTT